MICSHCKKEEETVTVGGKTYCAKCSTLLIENKKVEELKIKIPKMSFDENEIRVIRLENKKLQSDEVAKAKEILKTAHLPAGNLDELEGSAILLDILKDNVQESLDEKTLEKDKELYQVSNEVLNAIGNQKSEIRTVIKGEQPDVSPKLKTVPQPLEKTAIPKPMIDIKPTVAKRGDHIAKREKRPAQRVEDLVKKDIKTLETPLVAQAGFTKEYDLMIISFIITAVILVLVALVLAFR